jgi:ubiquinone/menaquinone biosynthesis C-methylase UbiE
MTSDVARFWDAQVSSFDEEPDHGLLDPDVRAAWREVLLPELPPAPGRVADLGCGTGSITVLLAQAGYDVHGVDLSEGMVAAAKAKVVSARVSAEVVQGDAAFPPFEPVSFDVVFARHVVGVACPGGRIAAVDASVAAGRASRSGRGALVHWRRALRRPVPGAGGGEPE